MTNVNHDANLAVNQTLDTWLKGILQVLEYSRIGAASRELQRVIRRDEIKAHANPINRCGFKFYSQNDEDGIIEEITRRITTLTPLNKSFIEMGVGNGLESNSILLLMKGWRGAWIGNQDLAFPLPVNSRLTYVQGWITLENALARLAAATTGVGTQEIDMFSMDLDGNDLHICRAMLDGGLRPKFIVTEYNAKFPPPIEFCIDYRADHRWDGTDYFGASFQSFAKLFAVYGYRPVCCNVTGANAFFVRDDLMGAFADIPPSIESVYQPANYGTLLGMGHPPSARTIAKFLV